MKQLLGRLEKVKDIRGYWEKEDKDFTPWLAEEGNLRILSETLGLNLQLVETEKFTGRYKADIVCKNGESDDDWVVIENQLEGTDHKHLGQIISYASWLDAKVVIWIASDFTEEHKTAIDWLNTVTTEDMRFFAIQLELWKINGNVAAPYFKTICQPNSIRRDGRKTQIGIETSERLKLQNKFWSGLQVYLKDKPLPFNLRPSYRTYSYNFYSFIPSKIQLAGIINQRDSRIGIQVYFEKTVDNDKVESFYTFKDEIERELGCALHWNDRTDNQSAARIVLYLQPVDWTDASQWESKYFPWFIEWMEKFYITFDKYIQKIPFE